ncbi:esterase/lipase family protein [Streptomyces sp. NPDC058739]|uniref:esterase/lipase family protein n=1 Tax=Streptomyces sp. NPDC058739 TaxID=3346618 RepID=UPI0036836A96
MLEDTSGRRVWGPAAPDIARPLIRPSALSMEENRSLLPVGLLPTLGVAWPVRVPGYDRLIRKLRNTFADVRVDTAVPGRPADPVADVLLAPYDFRTGVAASAAHVRGMVEERLSGLSRKERQNRLIVIGHSMGGLVARYWLGPLGGAEDCRALITVGTPHGGAPKALDLLAGGVRLGPRKLRNVTEVFRGWPSAYDLLPRFPAISGADGRVHYPKDLSEQVFSGFAPAASRAYSMHTDIDSAWQQLDGRVDTVAVHGRGHETLLGATLSPTGVSGTLAAPAGMPNPDWLGDGTVPAFGSIPADLADPRLWWPTAERHLPMASASPVIELLRAYSGDTMAAVRGNEDDAVPGLGLDLEEFYPAGKEITISARLAGAPDGERTKVWVSVRRTGCPAGEPVAADRLDDRWVAMLDPLEAGEYTVTVEAVNVVGVGRLACTDLIGVYR